VWTRQAIAERTAGCARLCGIEAFGAAAGKRERNAVYSSASRR
jgi:hypothetical protein